MIDDFDVLAIVRAYEVGREDAMERGEPNDGQFDDHPWLRTAYKKGYDAGITAYCKAEGLDRTYPDDSTTNTGGAK